MFTFTVWSIMVEKEVHVCVCKTKSFKSCTLQSFHACKLNMRHAHAHSVCMHAAPHRIGCIKDQIATQWELIRDEWEWGLIIGTSSQSHPTAHTAHYISSVTSLTHINFLLQREYWPLPVRCTSLSISNHAWQLYKTTPHSTGTVCMHGVRLHKTTIIQTGPLCQWWV